MNDEDRTVGDRLGSSYNLPVWVIAARLEGKVSWYLKFALSALSVPFSLLTLFDSLTSIILSVFSSW